MISWKCNLVIQVSCLYFLNQISWKFIVNVMEHWIDSCLLERVILRDKSCNEVFFLSSFDSYCKDCHLTYCDGGYFVVVYASFLAVATVMV